MMELIGVGRQAEVYAVSDAECIKLFYEDCPRSVIEDEAQCMRIVSMLKVGAPEYYGLTERSGRTGIRMERLHGETLLSISLRDMEKGAEGCLMLGRTQRAYHQKSGEGLSDMLEHLRWHIRHTEQLPAKTVKRLLERLDEMPKGNRLVHMDYHADNVMLTDHGARVIDWCSACSGNPMADVARTLLTMELPSYPPDIDQKTKDMMDQTRAIGRELYLQGYGANEAELNAANEWKVLIAASRLGYCPPQEVQPILAMIGAWMG